MLEILKLLLILAILVIANIVLGTYKNIKVENMEFDFFVLLNGLIKGLVIGFGFFSISLALLQLPELSTEIGIEPHVMIYGAIIVYAQKAGEQLLNAVGLEKSSGDKITESGGE